ncbi:MAG: carboxypeptidase regulatory-like domain-containing protein [Clostridiales bacterium]|nr:carboxypeptidase regulatory-like domain-containing protein [Clostridiales bacterium]
MKSFLKRLSAALVAALTLSPLVFNPFTARAAPSTIIIPYNQTAVNEWESSSASGENAYYRLVADKKLRYAFSDSYDAGLYTLYARSVVRPTSVSAGDTALRIDIGDLTGVTTKYLNQRYSVVKDTEAKAKAAASGSGWDAPGASGVWSVVWVPVGVYDFAMDGTEYCEFTSTSNGCGNIAGLKLVPVSDGLLYFEDFEDADGDGRYGFPLSGSNEVISGAANSYYKAAVATNSRSRVYSDFVTLPADGTFTLSWSMAMAARSTNAGYSGGMLFGDNGNNGYTFRVDSQWENGAAKAFIAQSLKTTDTYANNTIVSSAAAGVSDGVSPLDVHDYRVIGVEGTARFYIDGVQIGGELTLSDVTGSDAIGFHIYNAAVYYDNIAVWNRAVEYTPVSKSALEEAIAAAPAEQGDYTNDSWAALVSALTAAVAADADPFVNQNQADAAAVALTSAKAALLREGQADKSALAAAVAAAKLLDESEYTAESYAALSAKVAAAEAVLADDDAEQSAVNDALTALEAAAALLVESVKLIFWEDFEGETYRFETNETDKKVIRNGDNHVYAFNRDAYAGSLVFANWSQLPATGTFTLSADMAMVSRYSQQSGQTGWSAGVVFGKNGNNFYHFRIDNQGTRKPQLLKSVNGGSSFSSSVPLNEESLLLNAGAYEAFNFTVIGEGGTAAFYINGVQQGEPQALTNITSADDIGFRVFNGAFYFDNVAVYRGAVPYTPVDKSDLIAAADGAAELSKRDYTRESWEAFAPVLAAAKDVAADGFALQPRVNAALDALESAIEQLVPSYAGPMPLLDAEDGEIVQDLGGTWRFKTDPGKDGENQKWYDADTSDWDTITVPGNWDVLNEYANYTGIGWYARSFEADEEWDGYPIYLRVDSAYFDSKIFINGQLAGTHNGGYTQFELRVDEYLEYGAQNTIAISCDNTYSVGAWWKWGGLSGGAELVAYNDTRFIWQHIIPVPDLDTLDGAVDIEYKIQNSGPENKDYTIVSEVYDKATGVLVGTLNTSVTVPAKTTQSFDSETLILSNVKLWDYDYPNLYTVKTYLKDGESVVHALRDNIGFRVFEISGTDMLLNGQKVRLTGANRVWDDRVNGNTEPEYLWKRDFDYMKSMGMNITRTHIPMTKELLDYCDEIGFLTMQECGVWGGGDPNLTNNKAQYWYAEMINERFNHPNIVAWSLGNELSGGQAKTQAYAAFMVQLIKGLDPSRYVTEPSLSAQNANVPGDDSTQYSDFNSHNSYGGFLDTATKITSVFQKPLFFSEYGGGRFAEGKDNVTGNFQNMINAMAAVPGVFGASVWTLNDYRSCYTDSGTSQNRIWGVTDVWGNKKVGFERLRSASSPVESASVSFTADLEEGSGVVVMVSVAVKPVTSMPTYPMIGYMLKAEYRGADGSVIGGRVFDLPDIYPGAEGWSAAFADGLTVPAGGVSMARVTVISPLGYEIYENISYYQAPAAPVITEIVTGLTSARVAFTPVSGAQSYLVRYGADEAFGSSVSTVNYDYVIITGLSADTEYSFKVIAVNAARQTESDPQTAQTGGTDALAPTRIEHVEPILGGFYVGYSGGAKEDVYEIEYGTQSGVYTTSVTDIQTEGAFRVDGLAEGQTYYFRFRTVNGADTSPWSHEIAVTTETAAQARSVPVVYGAVGGDGRGSVTLDPPRKATGYVVKYGENPDDLDQTITVDNAVVGQILISGLINGTTYYAAVASLNGDILSDFSPVVSFTPSAEPELPMTVFIGEDLVYEPGETSRDLIISAFSPIDNETVDVVFTDAPFGISAEGARLTLSNASLADYPLSVGVIPELPAAVYTLHAAVWHGDEIVAERDIKLTVLETRTLLTNGFDDASGLTVSGDGASVTGGELVVAPKSASTTVLVITGESEWENYVVEGDVTISVDAPHATENLGGGIVFRYKDSSNYYHARIVAQSKTGNPQLQIYRFGYGGNAYDVVPLPPGAGIGAKVHYKVVNMGDTVVVYVNDTLVHTLTDLPPTGGKVGFRSYGAKLTADDLLVYALTHGGDAYTVYGAVIDSQTRTPVAGAVVTLRYDDGTKIFSLTSDESGEYEFDVPDGDYYVVAAAAGYDSSDAEPFAMAGVDLAVADLELTPAADVTRILSMEKSAGGVAMAYQLASGIAGARVVIAVYSAGGRLLHTKSYAVTPGFGMVTLETPLPSECSVKGFIWSEEFVPLTEPFTQSGV